MKLFNAILSLRFVPTLMDDTPRIMNAQKALWSEGTVDNTYFNSFVYHKFKRADALRCYGSTSYQGVKDEQKYRRLSWNGRDYSDLIIIIFSFLWINAYLKS